MKIQEAAEIFSKIVKRDYSCGIPEEGLTDFQKYFIVSVLRLNGIKYEIIKEKVSNFVCFKLKDPFIEYLILGDSEFMWCINDLTDSIHPNAALKYILKQYRNIDTEVQDRFLFLRKIDK
jgi:hypothetical protein